MSLQIAGHGVFLLPGGVCRRVCTPVRLEGVEPDAKHSDDVITMFWTPILCQTLG